ncbi:hypothetical protein HH212_21695 [Massilia forsythiae]|uniref:Uncharacterized protein n=1 Tax=Massilia forsythiae TaxID=2728020 RepID=A0A7Z2VZK6_9BURK|nr:hypothetical protein [Massilia forsythiae]QJE02312.1 hypothetical protein HH212_21695 [Massilia forsythiae]
MVFTLLFAAACALVGLVLFNSGMLANAKTRLQNAGDAGAYSAAVLQARDHNFSAYLNRATVANQVAVVQLASLKSYLEDAAHTHRRMGETALSLESSTIPADKPLWETAHGLPIESVAAAYADAAGPAVEGLDRLVRAFEAAQDAHHVATALDMTVLADEVVRRNDPSARLTGSAFSLGTTAFEVERWSASTTAHRANDDSPEADRFADVVVSEDSTDPFTRNRLSAPLPGWGPATSVKACRALPNYLSSWTVFGFTHAGGSILAQDKKRWLALDATWGTGVQSCTFLVPCLPAGLCPWTDVTPLVDGNFGRGDSGGAVVGRNGGYDGRTGYRNNPASTAGYGAALSNPLTLLPAQVRYHGTGPGATLDAGGGLQDWYRDVADPTSAMRSGQGAQQNGGAVAVTIEVERTGAGIRTADKFMASAGSLRLDPTLKGGTMRALSSAHAYFYRSNTDAGFTRVGWARADGKTELANLFNPYWQSRLVDRTPQERTTSWSAQ